MERFFMNTNTGSVDTEENWTSEGHNPNETDCLVEVVKNETGDWIEKE